MYSEIKKWEYQVSKVEFKRQEKRTMAIEQDWNMCLYSFSSTSVTKSRLLFSGAEAEAEDALAFSSETCT